MKSDWIKTRQTKYTLYITVYLAVIVAVLGAANWLANRHNKSFDSTANKKFSLSDQTIKVVKELKQDVTITDYDKTSAFTGARDLLDRYDNLSSKLRVVYVDPDKKPQEAKLAGIRSYGQIFVDSGIKKEEAKSLTEEEITGALIRSLKSGERNACFVKGNGENSLDNAERFGYSLVKESLEKANYKTRAVTLAGAGGEAAKPDAKIELGAAPSTGAKSEVPSDCTVLIVAGPKTAYPQPLVDGIQGYLNNGGRALILLDPPLKVERDVTQENVALEKMLDGLGVTVNKDLALDLSGVGRLFGMGPEVSLVSEFESHPIVRDLKGTRIVVPLARTLDAKTGGAAAKLFSTSEDSVATTSLSPPIRLDPAKDKKGPFLLAAAGTVKAAKEGRFVVVGSSTWIANNYMGGGGGNRDLFLNMMNWLSSDEDLISIRPKDPEDRRLTLTSNQMRTIFSSSVVGLPLIVIAAGMMVWWKRR